VLLRLHHLEVGDQRIEIAIGQVLVRRHVAVAERGRVADVLLHLIDRTILDDALRHVQIGADRAALAVDRVAGDALAAEDDEASSGGRVSRHVARDRVGKARSVTSMASAGGPG
jgi:hypothetical protein